MLRKQSTIRTLFTFILFVSLQTIAILMIFRTSIIQQIRIDSYLVSLQMEIQNTTSKIIEYFSLTESNIELLEQNLALMNRLSAPIDTADIDTVFRYQSARVVINSVNKKSNFIIIDKGSNDGVKPDMGVVTPNGVVGIIKAVSDKYSLVLSLLNIDRSVNISAKLSNSNAFGPLMWDGIETDIVRLTDIPFHIKYKIGDTISTSGYSSIFPPNIPIGIAQENKIKMGTYQDIRVRLFQDFCKLKFVYIVRNNDKEEITNLIKSGEVKR